MATTYIAITQEADLPETRDNDMITRMVCADGMPWERMEAICLSIV